MHRSVEAASSSWSSDEMAKQIPSLTKFCVCALLLESAVDLSILEKAVAERGRHISFY